MARNKLTVTKIAAHQAENRNVKPPKKPRLMLGDGDGLYLRESASGTRSWVFVYFKDKKRREIGLGSYMGGTAPVSLSAARIRADVVRQQLAAGIDPLDERKKSADVPTFGKVADDYIEAQKASWTNDKHSYQWEQTLGDAYCATIRPMKVNVITPDDVLKVLEPIWLTKAETATRLRMRLEKVLEFAKVKGWRDGDNPARREGNLDVLLPKRERSKAHHAALAYTAVPGVMTALSRADGVGAQALRFTVLTASRSGEVFGALWSEFDLEAGLWVVPAERMKARKEHRVPLSPQALAIVKDRAKVKSGDYVFPGQDLKRPISNMTMAKALKKVAAGVTVHGMRSAFRDWAGDCTTYPREVAEAALAHAVGDATEAAYRRGDALEKRRAMMGEWATYCAK